MRTRSTATTSAAFRAAVFLVAATAPAGCGDAAVSISSATESSIGQCTRDQAKLRGPAIDCTNDLDCPCGSFCEGATNTCAFHCNLPPAGVAESCPSSSQCDDTGRCVGTGVPTSPPAGILSANPPSLTTVPGGDAKSFQARLRVTVDNATNRATTVRVIGRGGAQVSCNAATFGAECALTGWTFSATFDGPGFLGAQTVWVRTVSGNPDGNGDVLLQIDATGAQHVVAAGSQTSARDGFYTGTARSVDYPDGIPVTAVIQSNANGTDMTVLRDSSRILASDGVLMIWGRNAQVPWAWLRGPNGSGTVGALVGWFKAGNDTVGADGSLEFPLTVTYPSAVAETFGHPWPGTVWTVRLSRVSAAEPECQTTSGSLPSGCASGDLCASETWNGLNVCIPMPVWEDMVRPKAKGNRLDDARSAQWWTQLSSAVGTTDPALAFGTSGADLIETLMCTTSGTAQGAGRLGRNAVHQGPSSFSGDLACVGADGVENQAPGAVGLLTYRDRHGTAGSGVLLDLCLQDLARAPTSIFASNFGVTVGECVNLARFLPAIRLLATGDLGKVSQPLDIRSRSLFVRLLQQWTVLHGFLASTGLAARELDDAVAATLDETRAGLFRLLDALDDGWGALIDQRIAFKVATAVNPEYVSAAHDDYRTVKRPALYWPFNTSGHRFDVIRGAELVPQASVIAGHPHPTWCDPDNSVRASFMQWFDCPGYEAALPAGNPDLSRDFTDPDQDLSVLVNFVQAGQIHTVFDPISGQPFPQEIPPPYWGGTLVVTPTLALGEQDNSATFGAPRTLVVTHPTQPFQVGSTIVNRETVVFDNIADPSDQWLQEAPAPFDFIQRPRGMTVAVVRNAAAMTYTLYVWDAPGFFPTPSRPGLQVFTRPYAKPVQGTFDGDKVLIGAYGKPLQSWEPWSGTSTPDIRRSYFGAIDDVAVYFRAINQREFTEFGAQRGSPNWVEDQMFAAAPPLAVESTQEIDVPLGAEILETQAAHLDVLARLVDHMRYQAQVACADEGDAGQAAKSDVAAVIARIGRTLRQSQFVEGLAAADVGDRANKARQLLRAKRGRIARSLKPLTSCANPYGMADEEVPLYHGDIRPDVAPADAFFAASDHLLALADKYVFGPLGGADATSALADVQHNWDLQRQSQIQQLQSDEARTTRLNELKQQYGGELIRLCGLEGQTPDQVATTVVNGTFSTDNCYVKTTGNCRAQHNPANILDADQTCYRGVIGASLMETRAAFRDQQAAFQSWTAARGNAEAEERLCVLKEMDLRGCSALDRHQLEGVDCPPGFEGTETLATRFREDKLLEKKQEGTFGMFGSFISAVVTGDPGPLLSGFATKIVRDDIDDEEAAFQKVLDARANDQVIRECWDKAGQFERAIGTAEQQWLSATSKMQAAAITFDNGLSQARQTVLEAPVVIDRELNRPSIPIAFNYWLPAKIEAYRTAMERARRYTYLALRAVEYDTQARYVASSSDTRPSRAGVLAAWRPAELTEQLARMHGLVDTRTTRSGPPVPGHLALEIGRVFFGLGNASSGVGAELAARVRPVFSTTGTYLGQGLRFSLLPRLDDEPPGGRCAERIWRVNFGSTGFPSPKIDEHHVTLLKGNQFASRLCDQPGFQVATHRDEVNLFVDDGEQLGSLPPAAQATADLSVVSFNDSASFTAFIESDSFTNGSSLEMSLQGLYGNYILLFPQRALDNGVVLSALSDLWLRFDYISVANTPPVDPSITVDATAPDEPFIIVGSDVAPSGD